MATFGIETYKPGGELLFSSRHMNVFYVDYFSMSGGSTSRSYVGLPYKIACQPVYSGRLEWDYFSNFLDQAVIAHPSYTVDYSNGYPILNVNYIGDAGTCYYDIAVYTWGEHL